MVPTFWSFAEGDEFTLELEILKGKSIKSIEITKYPESKVYSSIDLKKLNETFLVTEPSIFSIYIKKGGTAKKSLPIEYLS